jgi:2-C-methyl-D-erythritol 4-phosphate cytidylyltransferase
MNITAIILAAGSGSRTGLKYNKVLYEIKGKKVIDYSIERLKKIQKIKEIILVVSETEYSYFEQKYKNAVDQVIIGGKTRQESVFNALNKVLNPIVLIHDGARPNIPMTSLKQIEDLSEDNDAITLGVPVKDTIKKVSGNRVLKTFDRNELIITQTPQVFKKELLLEVHVLAQKNKFIGTDDAMLVEKFSDKIVRVIDGDYRNLKLTTLDDISILEVIL